MLKINTLLSRRVTKTTQLHRNVNVWIGANFVSFCSELTFESSIKGKIASQSFEF